MPKGVSRARLFLPVLSTPIVSKAELELTAAAVYRAANPARGAKRTKGAKKSTLFLPPPPP